MLRKLRIARRGAPKKLTANCCQVGASTKHQHPWGAQGGCLSQNNEMTWPFEINAMAKKKEAEFRTQDQTWFKSRLLFSISITAFPVVVVVVVVSLRIGRLARVRMKLDVRWSDQFWVRKVSQLHSKATWPPLHCDGSKDDRLTCYGSKPCAMATHCKWERLGAHKLGTSTNEFWCMDITGYILLGTGYRTTSVSLHFHMQFFRVSFCESAVAMEKEKPQS